MRPPWTAQRGLASSTSILASRGASSTSRMAHRRGACESHRWWTAVLIEGDDELLVGFGHVQEVAVQVHPHVLPAGYAADDLDQREVEVGLRSRYSVHRAQQIPPRNP